MRTRLNLVGLVLGLVVAGSPAAVAASASPSAGSAVSTLTAPVSTLTAPVCAEPFGQTDTPPTPRLERSVVDGMPVAVVLPPDYQQQQRRYPVLYLMHGMQGDEDSWIEYGGLLSSTANRPDDEQAIVVMPRLGVMTGLAVDWVDGYRHDATLVSQTLVSWVDRTYRTVADRQHRAVAGYSGGGLSAAHLAETFPTVFGQLGVFSGPVDLRNPATEPATWATLKAEQACAGDSPTAAGLLGAPTTHPEAWAAADPTYDAGRLGDTAVWLSSGNGVPCSPQEAADLAYPSAASEPSMRQQVDAFSNALTAAGVAHTNVHRPCGLHWWQTWSAELDAFWSVLSTEWRR